MNSIKTANWLTLPKMIFIILVIGLIIYFNSLFNGFFADDYQQIVDNPAVQSISSIPHFFTGSTIYTGAQHLSGNYYRPLLPSLYTVFYAMFGPHPFGYHLVQVFIHIINAVLLLLLFQYYFGKKVAFILSLLFLIHPINNEAVVYIANFQDTLFMCFGLAALVIQRRYAFKTKPIIVSALLFLSVLSKETGLLFLILLPLNEFLARRKKESVKASIMSGVVLSMYIYMRFFVAHIYFNNLATAPIMLLPLSDRLLQIPYIFTFYLKTFFLPINLLIFQTAVIRSISLTNFYIPLLITICFLIGILRIGIFAFKRSLKQFSIFLFFFCWFIAGVFLHLQIFPLDGTVADRWFYFPIVGFLGMFGVLLDLYWEPICRNAVIRKTWVSIFIIILILFSMRVIVRNANWKDQLTLIKHDIKTNQSSYQLEEGYGLELMKLGKLDYAYPHLLRSTQIFPGVNNLTSLGVYYGNTKQYTKAKETFLKAMQYDDFVLTYENYALLLFLTNDYQTCESFINQAVTKFPQSNKLWFYLSLCSNQLNHYDEAIQAATQAYRLNPDETRQYVLNSIRNHQLIDLSKL
jgi:hypothetical protein